MPTLRSARGYVVAMLIVAGTIAFSSAVALALVSWTCDRLAACAESTLPSD